MVKIYSLNSTQESTSVPKAHSHCHLKVLDLLQNLYVFFRLLFPKLSTRSLKSFHLCFLFFFFKYNPANNQQKVANNLSSTLIIQHRGCCKCFTALGEKKKKRCKHKKKKKIKEAWAKTCTQVAINRSRGRLMIVLFCVNTESRGEA